MSSQSQAFLAKATVWVRLEKLSCPWALGVHVGGPAAAKVELLYSGRIELESDYHEEVGLQPRNRIREQQLWELGIHWGVFGASMFSDSCILATE